MENNLNGRQTIWRTTSMEDDINGRQPQWKMTTLACPTSQFCSELGPAQPQLVIFIVGVKDPHFDNILIIQEIKLVYKGSS